MDIGTISVGEVTISPWIENGTFRSIGSVEVGGTPLRNPDTRFFPWFDTYGGEIFSRFEVLGFREREDANVLALNAISDTDYPFRERRDSSGDLCFRERSWDDPALEVLLRICFAPAEAEVDDRAFTGFKYWFEFDGTPEASSTQGQQEVKIHRLLDRQSWEVGGGLDDVTICLRNWLTPPRMRIERSTEYSTVGLEQWANLLPGNMWGRWTLLPSFDMQYGADGVLLGWFDEVSLIRTAVESNEGENSLRCQDFHFFENSPELSTNPKTILWCPDRLDEVEALNLWTRVYDRERDRSRRELGIEPEEPPPLIFSLNQWRGFRFDETYEHVVDVAGEFGGDYVFIDPVWENGQSFREEIAELLPEDEREGTSLEKFR